MKLFELKLYKLKLDNPYPLGKRSWRFWNEGAEATFNKLLKQGLWIEGEGKPPTPELEKIFYWWDEGWHYVFKMAELEGEENGITT